MSHDLFPIIREGHLAYMGADGQVRLELPFDHGGFFHEGLAYFSLKGKIGFIDIVGNVVIPAQFDLALRFYEGYSVAGIKVKAERTAWKLGVVDRSGKYVIEPQYESITSCSSGIVGVQQFITREVRYLRLPGLEQVCVSEMPMNRRFSDGLLGIPDPKTRKWGFVDTTGKWTVEPSYALTGIFSEGLASADIRKKGKELTGFIDSQGKTVIPFQFRCFRSKFSEGLASFFVEDPQRGDMVGAISKTGEVAIQPRFKLMREFHEGMAVYEPFGTEGYGYIDKTGKEVIPARFDIARDFSGGLAWVREVGDGGFSGYIDKGGEWVWKTPSVKLKDWPLIGVD